MSGRRWSRKRQRRRLFYSFTQSIARTAGTHGTHFSSTHVHTDKGTTSVAEYQSTLRAATAVDCDWPLQRQHQQQQVPTACCHHKPRCAARFLAGSQNYHTRRHQRRLARSSVNIEPQSNADGDHTQSSTIGSSTTAAACFQRRATNVVKERARHQLTFSRRLTGAHGKRSIVFFVKCKPV